MRIATSGSLRGLNEAILTSAYYHACHSVRVQYIVVIIKNILLSIYYVLGTRSGAFTPVYVYVYV